MCSSSTFSKSTVHVFTSWHGVNTYLRVPHPQSICFYKWLHTCWWWAAPGPTNLYWPFFVNESVTDSFFCLFCFCGGKMSQTSTSDCCVQLFLTSSYPEAPAGCRRAAVCGRQTTSGHGLWSWDSWYLWDEATCGPAAGRRRPTGSPPTSDQEGSCHPRTSQHSGGGEQQKKKSKNLPLSCLCLLF